MTGQEIARLMEVIDSNYVNEGEVTGEFERAIAARASVKHAIACTNGTSAIFLALAATGVGPGDEVLVPDLTFIATANAVRLTGARVVLVDVDPVKLTMDPVAAERAITTETKAIVPVHVSGRGVNMMALGEIAKRHGLQVVEDAAEALMSFQGGRMLGTIGELGCLSFSPNKAITTGQGGMVLTNDAELARRVRMLKDHGRPERGTGGDDIHYSVGYNFKLTNLQAAVGLAQLVALDERVMRQRRIHQIYVENLAGIPGLLLPGFDIAGGETPLWTDALTDRRNELDGYLSGLGMGCRRFWHPLHTQSAYVTSVESLKNSAEVSKRAIWLPSAFTLSELDVERVCSAIKGFFSS